MKLLYLGSTSVCLELENTNPYYAPEKIEIQLNGRSCKESEANVFSLFDLKEDEDYQVKVVDSHGVLDEITFHTKKDRCCLNVKDFGAVGDGVHEDTQAIQTAIHFMPEGGRLYFPAGKYLTLPLALKSHITLELAEGAVILGSTERKKYPVIPAYLKSMNSEEEIPFVSFEGNEMDCYQSLIHASYAEDIAIVGKGRIDGNAQHGDWWEVFEQLPMARPQLLFTNRCRDIVLHGVTFANSASWHLHPFYSQNISILDCFVTAPKDSPNTDAIDPESCDGVTIIGCRFSVGDDCIAIKSGKLDMARKHLAPADHHEIRNCLMEFGHGALTLGSELAGGIQNINVTQCFFRATDRGLRIKSRRGRGKDSIINQVNFDNIRMDRVLTPVVINLWYNCCDPDRFSEYVWSREKLPIDDRTPRVGHFTFKNMECTNAEVAACYIDGLTESPIEGVELENIRISFAEDASPGKPAMQNFAEERCRLGLYLDNVKEIHIKNVTVEGAVGKKLIANHYENIVTENFSEE